MATSSHLDQGALSAPALRIEAPPKVTVNHHQKKRIRIRRRRLLWGLGVVVAIGAGATWFVMNRGPKPTPVQLATVERADLQAKVTANGKVQAQKKVDMSATIAGQITRLAVEEGDRVTKGQFLLQIDATNPRAVARSTEASMAALGRELDSARAQLEQARIDFRRAEENHQARIISTADLDQARTALVHRRGHGAGLRATGGAGAGHPRRRPRHPEEDDGRGPDGRDRHRPARRGG